MYNRLICFLFIGLVSTQGIGDKNTPEIPLFVQPQEKKLLRCSLATVKALKVFKVGHAALFAENCSLLTESFFESEKQLSFLYYREIPGEAFAKAADNFLKKNLSETEYDKLKNKIVNFNNHYQNIKDGDRYDLHYAPENGLCLYLNGKALYRETDRAFSQAYFSIWLGNEPYSKALKNELLNINP